MSQFDVKTAVRNRSAIPHEPRHVVVGAPCRACPVRHAVAHASLGEGDRAHLASIGSKLQIARGQSVFSENDPARYIYTIIQGTVVIYKMLMDGRRQVTGFLFAGDFLGLADSDAYAYNADAVTDAILLRYQLSNLAALFARYPDLEAKLFAVAQHEIAEAQEQMLLLGRMTPREKVASFLLRYAARAALRGEDPENIYLPMKRSEIADYLGTTVETVSRTLSQLRKDGLVLPKGYNQISIVDREGLLRAAQ